MTAMDAALSFAGPQAAAAPLQAGYGASMSNAAAFDQALARADAAGPAAAVHAPLAQPPGQALQALMRPLEQINGEAAGLSAQARAATEAGRSLTPGEMVSLTVRCQEFMFHCQLTANVANRTSDGLQQLFRQQS